MIGYQQCQVLAYPSGRAKIGINKSNNDMGFMEGQFQNQYLGMASLTQGIFIIPKPDWIEENGIGDDDLKCEI